MDLETAERLAISLLQQHDLNGWSFSFDKAVRRFGQCDFAKKQITLSYRLTLANDEDLVSHVILHEITHALAGYEAKHGPIWKEWAKKVGVNSVGSCCPEGIVKVDAPIKQYCPRCKSIVRRHRLPPHWTSYSCFDCYEKGHLSPLEFTVEGKAELMYE